MNTINNNNELTLIEEIHRLERLLANKTHPVSVVVPNRMLAIIKELIELCELSRAGIMKAVADEDGLDGREAEEILKRFRDIRL